MTNRQTSTLLSLFGAAIMTIAMLAGVDGLSTGQTHSAQIAHTAASQSEA